MSRIRDMLAATTLHVHNGCDHRGRTDCAEIAERAAGVLRSDDRGKTWRAIDTGLPSRDVAALAVHTVRPDTVYTWLKGHGVFRTERGQPMGGMTGVVQMGFVIVDPGGTVRVQRVDIYFGRHAGQMLEIVRRLDERATPGATPG